MDGPQATTTVITAMFDVITVVVALRRITTEGDAYDGLAGETCDDLLTADC
jgi:hypothetical protein